MSIAWDRWLPVVVSICILIVIAILRDYNKSFAAIAAVMPINVPLGMWIVYAGSDDKQAALTEFSQALFVNILPTIGFMVVAWQMSKSGYGLVPTIAAGYAVWAVGIGLIFLLRGLLSA